MLADISPVSKCVIWNTQLLCSFPDSDLIGEFKGLQLE